MLISIGAGAPLAVRESVEMDFEAKLTKLEEISNTYQACKRIGTIHVRPNMYHHFGTGSNRIR